MYESFIYYLSQNHKQYIERQQKSIENEMNEVYKTMVQANQVCGNIKLYFFLYFIIVIN